MFILLFISLQARNKTPKSKHSFTKFKTKKSSTNTSQFNEVIGTKSSSEIPDCQLSMLEVIYDCLQTLNYQQIQFD